MALLSLSVIFFGGDILRSPLTVGLWYVPHDSYTNIPFTQKLYWCKLLSFTSGFVVGIWAREEENIYISKSKAVSNRASLTLISKCALVVSHRALSAYLPHSPLTHRAFQTPLAFLFSLSFLLLQRKIILPFPDRLSLIWSSEALVLAHKVLFFYFQGLRNLSLHM